MDNLPNGISADTEATLVNLRDKYEDAEHQYGELTIQIVELERYRAKKRAEADAALKEYHRRLGRIQREAAKASRGRR